MHDYIIVGAGLAGIAFAETAITNDKKVIVFENYSQNSSKVAAGIYNPVILKRFTATPDADEQLVLLHRFYKNIEKKLDCNFLFEIPVLRKFFSIEEQNDWFIAADKPLLLPFLSTSLITNKFIGIDSPYDFGHVLKTGWLDTSLFVDTYKNYLTMNSLFIQESFIHDQLSFKDDHVLYKNHKAKNIVFAEGFGMHSNPFFYNLPLDGTKGELLLIKAPNLSLNVIVNASLFIVPLGNHFFKVGATYNWEDKSTLPSEDGKFELTSKLREIINCDFEIIKHTAGVRPTVRDRRPLIGTHSDYKNVHILNGLGTRGVMLAPYLAKMLYENIECGLPIKNDLNINRFIKNKSR